MVRLRDTITWHNCRLMYSQQDFVWTGAFLVRTLTPTLRSERHRTPSNTTQHHRCLGGEGCSSRICKYSPHGKSLLGRVRWWLIVLRAQSMLVQRVLAVMGLGSALDIHEGDGSAEATAAARQQFDTLDATISEKSKTTLAAFLSFKFEFSWRPIHYFTVDYDDDVSVCAESFNMPICVQLNRLIEYGSDMFQVHRNNAIMSANFFI